MDWQQFVRQLDLSDKDFVFEFNSPAPQTFLQELKLKLNLQELPEELEELYSQSNGIDEAYSGKKVGNLIWNIERVIETNYSYRTNTDFKDLYMSFDQLLFFSDAGNGDLFGFTSPNGRFDRFDIFSWNHEDDSRTWVASNLKKFIEWWNNGKIKV